MDPLNIRQGATVYSADGEKLGKVISLEGQNLIVEKGFFFPTDYSVPVSLVDNATNDDIYLSVSKDQALNGDWAAMGSSTSSTLTDTTSTSLGSTQTGGGFAASNDVAYASGAETSGTIGSNFDAASTVDTAATTGDVLRVPVHEEELTATKRAVEQGQVRITKDVVAEDRTLDVPVTEERVRVTRRTVDRDATGTDTADAFDERTIDVPVRGEEVDVQKRVRVAEEVEVAKEAVQRTQRVGDTVRREEVRVEDQTTGTMTGSGDVASSSYPG